MHVGVLGSCFFVGFCQQVYQQRVMMQHEVWGAGRAGSLWSQCPRGGMLVLPVAVAWMKCFLLLHMPFVVAHAVCRRTC